MIGHVFPPGIPVVSQGSFSWAWAGLLCSEVEAWGERQCSQWWRGARGREGSWLLVARMLVTCLRLLSARVFVTAFVKMHFWARACGNGGVSRAGWCSFPFTSSQPVRSPERRDRKASANARKRKHSPSPPPPTPAESRKKSGKKG